MRAAWWIYLTDMIDGCLFRSTSIADSKETMEEEGESNRDSEHPENESNGAPHFRSAINKKTTEQGEGGHTNIVSELCGNINHKAAWDRGAKLSVPTTME